VEKEMQVAPLSEARAQFYLGDLLLHTDRLEEAEMFLQKAALLDPGFPGTHASMGLLKVRQQRHDEALTFLTRAVESDSQNYIAHYYYATMLLEQQDDQDEDARQRRFQLMRTHLKRSIELAPRYIEAYRMLGYVSLFLRDDLPETETLLKKAVGYSPGRHELLIDLAQVMLANDETAAARALLGPLRNSADTEVRYRATQLLETIDARLQYERDLRDYEQRQADVANDIGDSNAFEGGDKDDLPALRRTPAPGPSPVVPVSPRQTGPQVEGLLTQLDCSNGLTLHIQIGTGMVRLHTDKSESVEFSSDVPTIKDSIGCGPLNPPAPVTVSYRRTANPSFLGEPIRVLFVDRK
jgi:tetratricopeptide (TPR) repeat protein